MEMEELKMTRELLTWLSALKLGQARSISGCLGVWWLQVDGRVSACVVERAAPPCLRMPRIDHISYYFSPCKEHQGEHAKSPFLFFFAILLPWPHYIISYRYLGTSARYSQAPETLNPLFCVTSTSSNAWRMSELDGWIPRGLIELCLEK